MLTGNIFQDGLGNILLEHLQRHSIVRGVTIPVIGDFVPHGVAFSDKRLVTLSNPTKPEECGLY